MPTKAVYSMTNASPRILICNIDQASFQINNIVTYVT